MPDEEWQNLTQFESLVKILPPFHLLPKEFRAYLASNLASIPRLLKAKQKPEKCAQSINDDWFVHVNSPFTCTSVGAAKLNRMVD